MRAVEVERAGQGNNGAMGSIFGEHDQVAWPVAVVLLLTLTSACAAPDLRAWAASGTEMASTTKPTVLADLELDSITAAGVAVDVGSVAVARGDLTLAATSADTVALSREAYDLGLGFTRGLALACCGEGADVEVASMAVGSGDIVRSTTHSAEQDGGDGRRWAHGNSVGFVLALSFKKNWGGAGDQREAIVGELNATYADLDTQLHTAALDFHRSNGR
jgi:hypothetical protein